MEAETPSARSSSSSNKPAGISREAQGTTVAPRQQRNAAKVNAEAN